MALPEFMSLAGKFRAGTITPVEKARFASLLEEHETDFKEMLDKELGDPLLELQGDVETQELIYRMIRLDDTPVRRIGTIRRWGWVAAAALLFVGTALYWWQFTVKQPQQVAQADILPGSQGAILTLGDGSQIVLDSLADGIVAQQAGSSVTLKNGALNYETGEGGDAYAYNTMTTPKGRQFRLTLPDGSRVWLNAASSIRFPTAFGGKERLVEITGEAYFEIARRPQMPFRVKVAGKAEVAVLGTAFNVNAYADEALLRTTLVEGAVKVSMASGSITLKPGQQADIRHQQLLLAEHPDVAQAIAWKNGFFSFRKAGLEDVMRQLARWYDVEIVYEGKMPQWEFTGRIDRNLSLKQVLDGLAKGRLQYKITNSNRIIILP